MEESTKNVVLNLTGLEIFFIATTVLSLFFNLYQFMTGRKEKEKLREPLSNSLIALFNEIKQKSLNAYATQQFLFNASNPHNQIETLKWEYSLFAQNVMDSLKGFQEMVVGMLITLNPKDREGKIAFRSTEYGLTEYEKEFNKLQAESWNQIYLANLRRSQVQEEG